MENIVVVIILAAIVGGIVWYLCKTKRRGAKCVSCPYAKQCNDACSCSGEKGEKLE